MRITSQMKMGFYAFPSSLLPTLTSYLGRASLDVEVRLLDPCCGYGEALAHLGQHLGPAQTWGAELSDERAVGASAVLTKVHHCDWQTCRVGKGSVSLIWVNPPYDYVANSSIRQEEQFLFSTTALLATGGVLVYVIPQDQLGNRDVAKHLAGRYEHLRIERFPDGEFEAFKQVVVFGIRRGTYQPPTDEAIESITQLVHVPAEMLSALSIQAAPIYLVPAAPERDNEGKPPRFKRLLWSDEALIAAADAEGVHAVSRVWRDRTHAIGIEHHIEPAMPLKKGHIAMLMAAGLMGVMVLVRQVEGRTELLLAKGRVVKDKEITTEFVESGGDILTKTVERDKFVTTVSTINAQGEITVIADVQGLSAFMTEFGEQLGQQVIAMHKPAYDLKPTEQEWTAVAGLAQTMRLPGRKEGGLLAAQKHVAIAAMRGLRKHKSMILVGEMGFGKSVSAAAVATIMGATYLSAEKMGAWPALVVCPPHLVRKWAKEIERAIPGSVARVVNCVERGRDVPDDDSTETGKRRATKLPLYSIMDFVREFQAGQLGHRAVAIISRESAKLGSGWAPVANIRKGILHSTHANKDGENETITQVIEYLTNPETGALLYDSDPEQPGVLRNNPAAWKYLAARQRFSNDGIVTGWMLDGMGRRTGTWGNRNPNTPCFTMAQGTGDFRNLPEMRGGKWVRPEPRANLENKVGYRRYPLADFIHKKLKGFFKLFIADEVHEFKAADSDQAIAFHKLSRACRYTLGLTGTLFGGKSTNLLYLLHRTIHAVRAEYGPREDRRWAANLGRLETTRTGQAKAESEEQDSAMRGITRSRTSVRELPGVSPVIVRYLLPQVIFARITDLGYALPPYEEEIVRLDMDTEQAAQYHTHVFDPRFDRGRLYTMMREELKHGRHRLLSVWLQTALCRPNSGYREDIVKAVDNKSAFTQAASTEAMMLVGKRRDLLKKHIQYATVMTLKPVIKPHERSPKERYLMGLVAAERAQGRKVLIYCRQTGEKDIQPRLAEVLKEAGLRVKILRSTVPPEEREAWVEANIGDTDVLITNPRIVQTGLDLIMFQTFVFFEPDYSLFVLWQAMRRLWRLGQTQPVKGYFLSYNNTLEALAWSLMGKKLYAAQMLYGDEVGGAIVESDDEGFLAELAREALNGAQVNDLTQMFAAVNKTSGTELELGAVATLLDNVDAGILDALAQLFEGDSLQSDANESLVTPETSSADGLLDALDEMFSALPTSVSPLTQAASGASFGADWLRQAMPKSSKQRVPESQMSLF